MVWVTAVFGLNEVGEFEVRLAIGVIMKMKRD